MYLSLLGNLRLWSVITNESSYDKIRYVENMCCPICGANQFQNDEIQIYNILRVVKLKK